MMVWVLEVLPSKHLVLLGHVVIMEVHKPSALDKIIRLLLIIDLEVARHI